MAPPESDGSLVFTMSQGNVGRCWVEWAPPIFKAQSVHLRNIYIKLGGLIRDPGRTNLVGQPPQGITRTGTWALLDNHSHSSPTIFYEFWNILEQPHFSRARDFTSHKHSSARCAGRATLWADQTLRCQWSTLRRRGSWIISWAICTY